MRLIAQLDEASAAHAVCDFLEVEGIESEVRESKGRCEVWVLDDDQLERAEALLKSFDPESDHSKAASARRKERDRQARPMAAGAARGTGVARDAMGVVTIFLIGASVIVAVLSQLGDRPDHPLVSKLFFLGSFEEPWRAITPMFLHFGLLHVLFNMLWLVRLASHIEARHGSLALVLLAIAAQVPGSIAQYQISGPLFGGMSGVVFGLFGFVWMQARYGNASSKRGGYRIDSSEALWMMGWLVLSASGWVIQVGWLVRSANACHAIGLAVGLLAGLPAYLRYAARTQMRRPFAKGSWEDLNVKGLRRLQRLYIEPFMPLWFLLVAVGVLLLDL